jgi:hypothetical protein
MNDGNSEISRQWLTLSVRIQDEMNVEKII